MDEEEQLRNQHEGEDFDYHDDDDQNENQIPKDLDGWCWACSESESDLEEGDDKTCKASKDDVQTANHHHDGGTSGIQRMRVAETREEYIECKEAGLLFKPANSTLGVHPASCTWRASYCDSKHYGRTWGTNRSPKKALLEVLKLILEDHINLNKGDKIAKGQLARVTKAWNDA